MFKNKWLWIFIILALVVGATYINTEKVLLLSAVDATPLDGSTASRTYMASDRVAGYTIPLKDRCDIVDLYVYSTTAQAVTANDAVVLNIYGYGSGGPSMPVYDACTFTFGTAVSTGTGLYADTASGTDLHATTTGVTVTDSGNNRIVRLSFDTTGFEGLYVEPETFTGVTGCYVVVRQYGFKGFW